MLGFKPRDGSHAKWGPCSLGKSQDHAALGCSLLPHGLESNRDFSGRKGENRLLLVGREKVPHGSGLTGDLGKNTADGAGSLNHGLLLLFLRYGTLDWAEREGRTVSVGILKDFSILMKTLSQYSKSV